MRILKFGGTSVGSAEGARRGRDILLSAWRERPDVVAVVSAVRGATDALLECARQAAGGLDGADSLAAQLEALHRPLLDLLPEPRQETVGQGLQALASEVGLLSPPWPP